MQTFFCYHQVYKLKQDIILCYFLQENGLVQIAAALIQDKKQNQHLYYLGKIENFLIIKLG